MSQDSTDAVLSQAVVCAYAIPGIGALVAAGFSIVQALYDAYGKHHPPPSFTTAQAIADLGAEIAEDIADQDQDDRLVVIGGWQRKVAETNTDIKDWAETGDPDVAEQRMAEFLEASDYDTIFSWFDKRTPGRERIESLPMYFLARTAYHSLCLAKLQYYAVSRGLSGADWIQAHSEVRTRYETSLQQALDWAGPMVEALDDAYSDSEAQVRATAATFSPPKFRDDVPFMWLAYNLTVTRELRRRWAEGHLDASSPAQVARFQQFLAAYRLTKQGLDASPLAPRPAGGGAAPTRPSRQVLPGTLGDQAQGTVRFLYETGPSGWVDVLADSPAAQGSIATQNAGSTNPGLYYQVGGGFLNGAFASSLTAAGQLHSVNKALAAAYDTRFGVGAFAADAAAASPREDRLTSLLVPLTPGVPPIGSSVYAMLYSVGPKLGQDGIHDEAAYKQIYVDALRAIATWNAAHPPIARLNNLRVTLLSTNAYAGASDKARLREQAAGLVIEAVLEAVRADAGLAALRILVNTNDTQSPSERDAFDAAARTHGASPIGEGFDLPLT